MNEALEKSIQKWQAIVDGTGRDNGIHDCALCAKYRFGNVNCTNCPVRKKTLEYHCLGSPYIAWRDFAGRCKNNLPVGLINFGPSTVEEAKRLAQAELDFLISLREV